jgi:hypothetical protein
MARDDLGSMMLSGSMSNLFSQQPRVEITLSNRDII